MIFGLSPWLLLGALVGSIALAGGGYWKGDIDTANRYQTKIDKLQIDAQAQVQKVRDANLAQANAAIATLESQNAQSKIVYRTITQSVDKIVDRPVYRDGVCLDSDGLMLVNLALAGVAVETAAPRQLNVPMPAAVAP